MEDPASDDARRLSRAALWFLQYLAGRVDGISFSAKDIARQLRSHGYEEVSDQALALLLACVRRISSRDRQVRAGRWDIGAREPVYRIAGKVLGLVGYGAIARTLHRKMAGFEPAEVLVHDAFIPADRIEKAGARAVPLQELLARSDFVSLHVPLTESTRHLIDRDALGTMKPTAILVNTSRGGVVDTDALYEALKAGRIAAAGLDVHEQEPPPPDYKLFDLDNVVLTDHAGWYSEEAQEALQRTTARNVALVLAGGKPLYCVNPEVL